MHNGHRSRMREKVLNHGFDSLFPHEFLEFILFGSIPREDTNPLAHKLIHEFGSFDKVLDAPIEALMKVEGVGLTTATLIKSYQHAMRLYKTSKVASTKYLQNIGEVKNYLSAFLSDLPFEEFHVLMLNSNFKLLKHERVIGEKPNELYINMEKVMASIGSIKPATVIFCHNHPSGNPTPSREDIEFTKKYTLALKLTYNITVCDHLILGSDNKYFSFRHNGLLSFDNNSNDKNAYSVVKNTFDLGEFFNEDQRD